MGLVGETTEGEKRAYRRNLEKITMPNEREKIILQLKGFDAAHYRRTELYARQIDRLCREASDEYASLAGTLFQPDPNKPFSFDDYPKTKKAASRIANDLARQIEGVVIRGTEAEWNAACDKNDAFLNSILKTSRLTPEEAEQYKARNLEALQGFQQRKVEGLGLSQRVWKYVGEVKDTIELGIDVGLGEGRSAAELSRDLRQCLQQPDKLFRRVRDKYGNLQLSKAAKLYHPGQGVYRSSAKNAQRLTRTEINMAYREAELLRWQQLDFVVGFRVQLSNNHTVLDSKGNPKPLKDICDELAGDYPKTFRFLGWHPQCRCLITPILSDYDEYNKDRGNRLKAIVRGEAYKSMPSRRQVTAMPENFTRYIESISERAQGWKSQPYYIRDNFKGGRIEGGLKAGVATSLKGNTITGTKAKPAVKNNTKPCTEYDAEIAMYKKWAYSFGLNVSRLDALRLAGNKDRLRAELDRLKETVDKRQNRWVAALSELYVLREEARKEGLKDVEDYCTQVRMANQRDEKNYYATSIKALNEAKATAKAKLKQAKAAAKKTLAQSGDKPHKALLKAYNTNSEVDKTFKQINDGLTGGKWLENGDMKLALETDPTCNGSTYMDGRIYLRAQRLQGVKDALGKIGRGESQKITESEANAMATFWHEITHNRHQNRIASRDAGSKHSKSRKHMELANEYVARKTLPEFYKELGCKKTPHPQFIDNRDSTGYNRMVCNYDSVVKKLGLDGKKVLDAVRTHLFTKDYDTQKEGLRLGLQAGGIKKLDGSKPKPSEIANLIEICESSGQTTVDNWLQIHGFTK